MTGVVRKISKILLVVMAVFAGLLLLAELLLLTPLLSRSVDKYASTLLQAGVSLNHGTIRASFFRDFPSVNLYADSLSITYPHSRYSDFDKRLVGYKWGGLGRGENADTLVTFDHLNVSLNLWRLCSGRIGVKDISVRGLGLYAREYDDSTKNWNLFVPSQHSSDTSRSNGDLSILNRLSVGRICIGDKPRVVFSDNKNSFEALLRLNELSLSGNGTRTIDFLLDSCWVHTSGTFGELSIPADIRTSLKYDFGEKRSKFKVKDLDANLAYIPLSGNADIHLLGADSTWVDGSLKITECPLGKIVDNYLIPFVPKAKGLSTNALLSLSADARGTIAGNLWPNVDVGLTIPPGNVRYAPVKLDARISLDADASANEEMNVNASVKNLSLTTSGLDLDIAAVVKDVFGHNPSLVFKTDGKAELEKLSKYIPDSLATRLAGNVNMQLSVDLTKKDLDKYKFGNAKVSGRVKADRIVLEMPDDTISTCAFGPVINLSSGAEAITAGVVLDSIYYTGGTVVNGRVRKLKTDAKLYTVERHGEIVPRADLTFSSKRLFFRSDDNRFGLKGARITASVRKKTQYRKLAGSRKERIEKVDELKEHGNIKLALDSTITAYFKNWVPSVNVVLDTGFFASPQLPLRTRLTKFDGTYDGRNFKLDSLAVICGSSDLSAKGSLKGLSKALAGKKTVFKTEMNLHSRRINVNELIAASQVGKKEKPDTTVRSETDESFVTDTLVNARIDSIPMIVIVLPGNVNATMGVKVDNMDIQSATVKPFTGKANLKDRTLQLEDVKLISSLGNIGLDAYYYTKSMSDIGFGVDLDLSDMSAANIIELLPPVDTLIPLLRSFSGNLWCKCSLTSKLDSTMNVIMPTLDGMLQISGKNLNIGDAGDYRKYTRMALFRNPDIGRIDDLYVSAVLHNGKVEVFPFELGVDRYRLILRGMLNADRSMYYNVSVIKSPLPFKFGINIYGVPGNMHFGLCRAKFKDGKIPVFTSQLNNMQLNIAQSIKHIYDRGVQGVKEYNEKSYEEVEESMKSQGYDTKLESSELITPKEQEKMDDYLFNKMTEEMEADVQKQVETVIEDTYSLTEKLVKEYEASYDKETRRILSRLNKQVSNNKK